MLPVELHVHISAPREEVFDLISDLGVRPAWSDNYQSHYRLAWPNSKGGGAGSRYLLRAPMRKKWEEPSIVEAHGARRIVERTQVRCGCMTTRRSDQESEPV